MRDGRPHVESVTRRRRRSALALLAATAALLASVAATTTAAPAAADDVVARTRTLHEAGALREAEQTAVEAIAAATKAGDTETARTLQLRRALVLADLGHLADAFEAVAPMARAPEGAGGAVGATLALLHLRRGDGASALAALDAFAAPDAEASNQDAEDSARPVIRGLALLASDHVADGERQLRAWLDHTPQTSPRSTIDAHLGLARSALDRNALDEASRHVEAALALARNGGQRLRLAEAHWLEGRRARLIGDTAAAETAFGAALAIAAPAPLPRLTAPVAHALYEGAAARGATADALEFLRLHTDARLATSSDLETRRLMDVVASLPRSATADIALLSRVPAAPAGTGASGPEPTHADAVRTALLGASLSALVLAAVLWRVGYTRGRRLLHYRQELDALKGTLTKVAALDGLVTICASCKDVCGETGDWSRVEVYLAARTDARFTHSICPSCEQRVLSGAGGAGEGLDSRADATALQGGFDWPPSDAELARVLRAAEKDQDVSAAPRGSRWA